MRQTVIALESFYDSPLGIAAQAMVMRRLAPLWPSLQNADVLGFGYTWPFLEPYAAQASRIALAMPDSQGAIAHHTRRGVCAVLVEETRLPFPDNSFDHILLAHAVEDTPDLARTLLELWRVTRPEGRIAIIAANRAGLWAGSDKSPFGSGRPFSRTQLREALRAVGFHPTFWSNALYIPPNARFSSPRICQGVERTGELVVPTLSGLVLVEAVKRLYAEVEGAPSKLPGRLVFRPGLAAKPAALRASQRKSDTP